MNRIPLGAIPENGGVRFRVWAPKATSITIRKAPDNEELPLEATGEGYFEALGDSWKAGDRYYLIKDGTDQFPDPASRFQPEGVHGPSEVVDPTSYRWRNDGYARPKKEDLVFYELHVGTFSPEGTFKGVEERLPYLKELGINTIEIMPPADWPGRWNWGYDHAALYAPSRAYGTPDELRSLVDAAHGHGIGVFLDVIYNHLGPDGAYLPAFAPLFTDKHKTPRGQAINLDDTHSEGVRNLFIDNALHWLTEYHIDGLRLDATHALMDDRPVHFLAELAEAVSALPGPKRYLIAEDSRNLNHMIRPRDEEGYGLDGLWVDDFHHLIRNITAGDVDGYYASYADTTTKDIADILNRGWYFHGQFDEATGEKRGTSAEHTRYDHCVVAIQNHDQVGNRPDGARLHHEIGLDAYRLASAVLLFAPQLPLLFEGQEWACTTPFLFFTDHNEELGKLVSEGRREEFAHFESFKKEVPDPQDPDTFERSCLLWDEVERPPHSGVLKLYKDLLSLRHSLPQETHAESIADYGLKVTRGAYLLYAAFRPDISLEMTPGETILHTEMDSYTEEPHPPVIQGTTVRFPVPSAIIIKNA